MKQIPSEELKLKNPHNTFLDSPNLQIQTEGMPPSQRTLQLKQ